MRELPSAGFLLAAIFGATVPNGLFIYWLFAEFTTVSAVLQNKLAMAFIIDAFLALGILSICFARQPIGRVAWQWFVVLSIAGGLGFSVPFYYWLNVRTTRTP